MINDNLQNSSRNISDSRPVVRKSIIIGIGGSGMDAVKSAADRIGRTIPEEAVSYIRFVGIDTAEFETGAGQEKSAYRMPSDTCFQDEGRILLIQSPLPAELSADYLREKHSGDPCYNWLPDPGSYEVPMGSPDGAGLNRSLGRLAFFINEKNIREALTNERDRLDELADNHEKFRIADLREDNGMKGGISVFITSSAAGGTGSGMFIDIASMVRDIFRGNGPDLKIYGILMLPFAYGGGSKYKNARANAYAALKEIDSFMSGTPFGAEYPSGNSVRISDRLFDDGMLYLLDVENMAGNSLAGRIDVPGMAGEFISAFLSSPVGDSIDGKTPGGSAYLPSNEMPRRRGSYSSFGISRAVYPVPELKEIGYRSMAVKLIEAFFKPVKWNLIHQTLGSIDVGLVRALRVDCRMIFERMNPDYQPEINIEMSSYRKQLSGLDNKEKSSIILLMEKVIRDYGEAELGRRKYALMSRIEKRYRLELEKIKGTLSAEIEKYISDPERGFHFADEVCSLLAEKLNIYQKKYNSERSALAWYSQDDMGKLLEQGVNSETIDIRLAEKVIEMASFNFAQTVYGSMLESAEAFTRGFRTLLFNIKNRETGPLSEKLKSVKCELLKEIADLKFRLLQWNDPSSFCIIDSDGINSFTDKYFYNRLSADDLCRGADIKKLLNFDDAARCKKNLFALIDSGLVDHGFDDVSIKWILDRGNISVNTILNKMDNISRPYICIDPPGSDTREYYMTAADFRINNDDVGDKALNRTTNDLPFRLNHGKKRESAEPVVHVKTFESPGICKPYEMFSVGILTRFPLFKINSLEECADDYHSIISDSGHPLHVFNHPAFDAKYFPDPLRFANYLNPAKLWSGLLLLKILQENDGVYSYEENTASLLKGPEARENYNSVVAELEKKILIQGGFEKIQNELLAELVGGLGILAKNHADGKLQFRKEYITVIMDLSESGGVWESDAGMAAQKGEEMKKNMQIPKFSGNAELSAFFESNAKVRDFIISSIKSVIERSRGSITAGADISLPNRKIEQTPLPQFRDRNEFYNYYEKRGSLEWQNILARVLLEKLDDYISSRFRLEDDPGEIDISKVTEFIKTLDQKMPEVVLFDISVKYGILK